MTAYRKITALRLKECAPSSALAEAQTLEAFALSDPQRRATAVRRARGVKSVSVGSASESYDTSYNPLVPETFGAPLLSARAYAVLRPYLMRMAAII